MKNNWELMQVMVGRKRWLIIACIFLGSLREASAQDKLILNEIKIQGNRHTHSSIILRELLLKIGDTLHIASKDSVLEVERRKIINTNLFNSVKLELRDGGSQKTDLLISVEERWYLLALPVWTLGDRNFNEWWYDRNHDLRRTTYGLYFSHQNLTGKADKLRLKAEFGFTPTFEISYSNPYFDKKQRFGFLVGTSYSINKSLAYRNWQDKLDFRDSDAKQRQRFSAFGQLQYRQGFYKFHEFELSYNYHQISDSLAKLNPNYFLNSRTTQRFFLASYSFRFDRRDNVQYPLRGYRLFAQATQQGLVANDDLHQFNIVSSFIHAIPINSKWNYQYGLRGKLSFPKTQPFLQTIGLGYRNDLVRGYELYVIDGQAYGVLKNSLKRELFNQNINLPHYFPEQFSKLPLAVYLHFFADVGYVRNHHPEWSNSRFGNKTLIGYGVGLDAVTWYNAVARLNFSVNETGESRFFINLAREF